MLENQSLKIIAWTIPLVLLLTTSLVFFYSGKYFGNKTGYLIGFIFYWSIWCLFLSYLFLTKPEIHSLLRLNSFGQLKLIDYFYLLLPLAFAYLYAFPKAVSSPTFQIIFFSALLAVINATLEEFLWRGVYFKLIGSDKWSYVLISSIGFAIWHYAPQIIFPNKAPGGQLSFVMFAFVLGVLFSLVTYNTKSILPVIICHILFDFSGLGARLYFT